MRSNDVTLKRRVRTNHMHFSMIMISVFGFYLKTYTVMLMFNQHFFNSQKIAEKLMCVTYMCKSCEKNDAHYAVYRNDKENNACFVSYSKMSKTRQTWTNFSKELESSWNEARSKKKSPKSMFALFWVKFWAKNHRNGAFFMQYITSTAISRKSPSIDLLRQCFGAVFYQIGYTRLNYAQN